MSISARTITLLALALLFGGWAIGLNMAQDANANGEYDLTATASLRSATWSS